MTGTLVALAAFGLASPAFHAGASIPKPYTCDGSGVSPPLRWSAPPLGTRSLALSVKDPDAPGGTFVHWTAWNISPRSRGLARGQRPPREGRNSAGTREIGRASCRERVWISVVAEPGKEKQR